jgi:hypothetical protein
MILWSIIFLAITIGYLGVDLFEEYFKRPPR